jgi:uncharacterized protein (DUF697 family)
VGTVQNSMVYNLKKSYGSYLTMQQLKMMIGRVIFVRIKMKMANVIVKGTLLAGSMRFVHSQSFMKLDLIRSVKVQMFVFMK